MGGTLSCGGRGHRPKDDDTRPYSAPVTKPNGIVAPSEKYIVPAGEFSALHAGKIFMIFVLSSAVIVHYYIFQNILSGITVLNSLDPDQARQNVGPDLGPNCLQHSADDKFRR